MTSETISLKTTEIIMEKKNNITNGNRITAVSLIVVLISIVMISVSTVLPVWKVKLYANNYPKGLKLIAYGYTFEGDLYELNIINHYVGMQEINPDEISIMALFPYAIVLLIVCLILTLFYKKYKRILALLWLGFPIGILAVIQWYLYYFGHHLEAGAPIRMPPFSPWVIGSSHIMNFKAVGMVDYGFILLVLGILTFGFGEDLWNKMKSWFPGKALNRKS